MSMQSMPLGTAAVWRDSTMTRAPTIDSGYEFPITDDFQVHGVLGVEKENEEEESKGILMSEGWDLVEPDEREEDHGGGGEESGDRRERSGGRVRHAVRSHDKERHTGPLGRYSVICFSIPHFHFHFSVRLYSFISYMFQHPLHYSHFHFHFSVRLYSFEVI